MGDSAEDVRHHLKTYWTIYGLLGLGTIITVAIAYYHLHPLWAILLAMVVASTKASLVGLYFMHLNNEKKIIYAIIALTIFMFLGVMMIPIFIHG